MDLSGKTALVTGGGTGIGAAITRRLVKDGAKVCIAGRRPEKLQETVASLPESSVIACPGDVSKSDDIKRIVAKALEIDGKLDILVNNAAIEAMGPVTALDASDWQQALDRISDSDVHHPVWADRFMNSVLTCSAIPQKSPVLAAVLSVFLPGSGHAYCHRRRHRPARHDR